MEMVEWKALENLRRDLILSEKVYKTGNQDIQSIRSSALIKESNIILRKIEGIVLDVLINIVQGKVPVLTYINRRDWGNVRYGSEGLNMCSDARKTKISFGSVVSLRTFGKLGNVRFFKHVALKSFAALTLDILSKVYILSLTNNFSTKREIYYQNPVLYNTQEVVDQLIDNISCMLDVPRRYLNILATSKGCIAGNLQYTDIDGNYYDCSSSRCGVVIPVDVDGLSDIRSQAKLVLIVEKYATFQKLLEENNLPEHILITGKGFPDLNTRQMVKKLWETLQLPTFALVDADPYGIHASKH